MTLLCKNDEASGQLKWKHSPHSKIARHKMVQEIEDFYGVYLLYCMNPKFKGRTYIGYTVDPNRRIKQHNTGRHVGGAWRTSGKGPWEMALIIHGFPNEISGLRFEWAWQNPHKSRRLKEVTGKSKKETAFEFRWRVVCNMLRTAPWISLSLTVRWLKQDFALEFPPGLESPLHMPLKYGPVVSKKVSASNRSKKGKNVEENDQPLNITVLMGSEERQCAVCDFSVRREDHKVGCLRPSCAMLSHLICLARHFLRDTPQRLLPTHGACPTCGSSLLWGELVRQMKGCHRNLSDSALQEEAGEDVNS